MQSPYSLTDAQFTKAFDAAQKERHPECAAFLASCAQALAAELADECEARLEDALHDEGYADWHRCPRCQRWCSDSHSLCASCWWDERGRTDP